MNYNFKEFVDSFTKLHEKVGYSNIRRYAILILLILGIFNIKPITKGIIEFVNEMGEEIHAKKMKLRDEYMTELVPLLTEFRTGVGADRVLYFEFHNSEENLEGVPFKFFDLMMCSTKYGLQEIPGTLYKDLNASNYTTMFDGIKYGDIIFCMGPDDIKFHQKYPGVYKLFSEGDHSKRQAIFSVPGLKQPIGFIVVEWVDNYEELEPPLVNPVDKEVVISKVHEFMPRLNALIVAMRK